MSKLMQMLLRTAGASLCLLGVPALAAPLKWAPPPLVNPLTIQVKPGDFDINVPVNRDCILAWPATKHVGRVRVFGCHNLVSMGGWNTIPTTRDLTNGALSRALQISNQTGTAHIEGLLIDGSGGGMSDAINIAAPLATVQIQNVRVDGIFGYNDMFHADCIQPFGGVKTLRVYNFTCRTGFQGLSIWPVPASPVGWTADVQRTNIVSIGAVIYGSHNSGGYLYWPCSDKACANAALTSLSSVYLQPRPGRPFSSTVYLPQTTVTMLAGTPARISFPGLRIIGEVIQGPPPGGDFVPVGVAGPRYVSPGYAR